MQSSNYFDYLDVYPELQVLVDHFEMIREEALSVSRQPWTPWPEDHYNDSSKTPLDWTVFPFMHTFPALDASKSQWIATTSSLCPRTVSILKQIPNLRTALLSRLGPHTELGCHTGWSDLANYVLRCHFCLQMPTNGECGMWVNEEEQFHDEGKIIVFDDSKKHKAFNRSPNEERIVLIVDLLRPLSVPIGTARGGHTEQLDDLLQKFH
jgi:aspartyl/asparaginyl beta-hydroxylase (cupin superfamily)